MTDTTTTLAVQIDQLRARRDHLANGQISAHDPRLTVFWDRAGEVATDHSMCSVYDELVEEVGGITREHDYAVPITLTISLTADLATTARDSGTAEDNFEHEVWDDLLERVADSLGIARDLLSHATVEAVDTGDAYRTDD